MIIFSRNKILKIRLAEHIPNLGNHLFFRNLYNTRRLKINATVTNAEYIIALFKNILSILAVVGSYIRQAESNTNLFLFSGI